MINSELIVLLLSGRRKIAATPASGACYCAMTKWFVGDLNEFRGHLGWTLDILIYMYMLLGRTRKLMASPGLLVVVVVT